MAKITRKQFTEILGSLIRGRKLYPAKHRGSLYTNGAACALGAILAGQGTSLSNYTQRYEAEGRFRGTYGGDVAYIITQANDHTPDGCDPDISAIQALRALVVD